MTLAARLRGLITGSVERALRFVSLVVPSRRRQHVADRWREEQLVSRGPVYAAVKALTGNVVASGPFAGLRFVDELAWGFPGPYLLGSYERELHGALEDAIAEVPATIVVIGAAEGYYAVGLSLRLPLAEVFAYDVDPVAHRACDELAHRNAVGERVQVRGECTPEALEEHAGPHTLLIVDCEGCEMHLLDPVKVPSLRSTRMIVELHDFLVPSATEVLLERFGGSHDAKVVSARDTELEALLGPVVLNLTRAELKIALDEARPCSPHPMRWAILIPRQGEQH